MSKIKILVVPGDKAGSGKFRCVDPHINLQKNYPEDFFIDINHAVDFNDEVYLSKYDIIFIHRIPQHNVADAVNIIKKIKGLGIKVIIDSDDHWTLDYSHGMYTMARMNKIPQTLIECFKLADMITVPTAILGNEIKKFNNNVVILPNAIDPTESQFQPKPISSDKIRFGWLGGSSHIKDIELLRGLGSAQLSISDKMQIVLCGFDTRGTTSVMDPETKEIKQRPITPQETTWFMYELFLTNNYKNLISDQEYLKYLTKFTDDPNNNSINKTYRRIWTKPITQYANGYNNFDVALAPLFDNSFNKYKSQLKVIEAGFHKKALIAQNYGPYTIDLVSAITPHGGYNPNGNCLLVETSKNHKEWVKHAKRLVENPEMIKQLGENLYNTVKDKYNINTVSVDRSKFYKLLINK